MAIQTTCSACGCPHTLEDRFQGKTIKCKQCAEAFQVLTGPAKAQAKDKRAPDREAIQSSTRPAPSRSRDNDPDDPPARRRVVDRDDDDDDRPSRRRRRDEEKSSMGLILGLIGGGVVVIGGIVALIVWLVIGGNKEPDVPVVAQNNPAVNQAQPNPPPQNNAAPPFNPVVPPGFQNQPPNNQPANDPPQNKQPKNKKPKANPNPANVAPPKIEQAVVAATLVGEWTAQPDPGPDVTKAPANPKAAQVMTGNPQIVFPSTPSPFVAVQFGGFKQEQWLVLDLQTGKPAGAIKGKPDMRDDVLSPDGLFLAGRGRLGQATTVNVYSFAAKKFLAPPIVVNTPFLKHHDFIEGNNIVTMIHDKFDTKYEIWNAATGQRMHEYTRNGWLDFKHNAAFSPGRKFLAVVEGDTVKGHNLVVLNVTKGDLAGTISLPKDFGNCKALAFSPDGTELAAYFEHFSQGRLTTWKMDKGEQGVDHAFAQSVGSLGDKTFFHAGPIMEWVPDKSGWLFYGQFWIDYPTGALVHTFPSIDDPRRYPHYFVGKDHRVFTKAVGQNVTLSIVALPKDEIAGKVKTARAGGEKGPAKLPDAKPADIAAAKNLGVPGGAVAWSVQPDPGKSGKALPPLSLRTTAAETAQVMFADNGQTVVLASIVTNALARKRFLRADRYDIAGGKLSGEAVLFPVEDAAGNQPRVFMPGAVPQVFASGEVSTDGNLIAIRATKDDPRLDIWNLQEGKHVGGWLPYDDDKVEWFRFIDGNRLLTMSNKGKLALWKVPDGSAIYIGDGYRGTPELSLGRKYVALLGPNTLEILDTETGTRRGLLEAPAGGIQSCPAAAFSLDGKSFAAIFPNAKGTQIARWNLATGTIETIVAANVAAAPLQWCSPKHVLASLTLFDLDFKNAIATYNLPAKGKAAGTSPDGRLWFTYESAKDKTLLTAVALPEPQAADITAQAAAGKVSPLIPPGTAVRVSVSSNSERFKTAVEQALNQRLQTLGYKTGAGGVTISVNTNVNPTGKEIEYVLRKSSKFGPPIPIGPIGPGGQVVKVKEFQVTCQSLITDQQGALVHKAEQVIPMPHSLRFKGDDIQTELVEAMWDQAIGWGNNAPLPTNLYRIAGQLVALPKVVSVQ